MGRKAITLIQGILLPDGIAGADVILCQHIGELLQVPNNHDIPCTGEGQYPGSQINLRGLIHNQVIIDMFNAQRSLDGIGRAILSFRTLPAARSRPADSWSARWRFGQGCCGWIC